MRTERGLSRLVGFADGVVAIAITLLILPLVDEASHLTGDVWQFVTQNSQELLVFVISFIVIGRFWLIHHGMYENVIDYSRQLLWWSLLWLLTIVFLPFPTELLATATTGDAFTHGLYIGTMFLTTIASTAQQAIIVRNPEMQAPEVRGTLRLQPSVIAMVSIFVAGVIAVTIPAVGLFALLLLAFAAPVNMIVDRVRAATKTRSTP